MAVIYHIATQADWEAAQARGRYEAASLETEGFLHASTGAQVAAIANGAFAGRTDLVLLVIEEARVGPEIRYENTEGGTQQFPHVYGPLNLDAVTEVRSLMPSADGTFDL